MQPKQGDTILVQGSYETQVTRVEGDKIFFLNREGVEYFVDNERNYKIIVCATKLPLRVLENTDNYIKAELKGEPEILHLVKSGTKGSWLCFWEDAYGLEPWRSGVQKKSTENVEKEYGIKPSTFYSIFDKDIHDYLHTGRNSLNKEDAFSDYLHYRSPDLGEWWENCKDLTPEFAAYIEGCPQNLFEEKYSEYFEMWLKEIVTTEKGVEFIMQDMAACNFELEELNEKLIEE